MSRTKKEPTEAKEVEVETKIEPTEAKEGCVKWKRPSGSTIETNDAKGTIEACEKMGWERL